MIWTLGNDAVLYAAELKVGDWRLGNFHSISVYGNSKFTWKWSSFTHVISRYHVACLLLPPRSIHFDFVTVSYLSQVSCTSLPATCAQFHSCQIPLSDINLLCAMPALSEYMGPHTSLARLQRKVSEPTAYLASPATKMGPDNDSCFPQRAQPQRKPLLAPTSTSKPIGLTRGLQDTPAQTLSSRLRLDRDRWRSIALQRSKQLDTMEMQKQERERTIAALRDEVRTLEPGSGTYSKYNNNNNNMQMKSVENTYLTQQIEDLTRTCKQLRKSDRAKGRSIDRNFQLIVALKSLAAKSRTANGLSSNNEPALQEALAMAITRIEDMELHGTKVLEALEGLNDTSGEDEAEEQANVEFTLVEAEVAFRSILEDDTFREHRENWACLLNE